MIKKSLFSILITIFITSMALAEQEVSVILSQGIIPYHLSVEGVKKKMSGFRFREYTLEKGSNKGQKILRSLEREEPDLILSVGPEAACLLKDFNTPSPRIFTMILNPEKIFPETLPFPGVSMNYPPSTLLSFLEKAFPERKKIGIFYSPDLNSNLLKQFEKEGGRLGLKIRPFPINSSTEIRSTLKSPLFDPDIILFIPDQVIIKKKLVNYIIEECLFRKIPAIGFNTWFARSGALMAFYLDYEEVGRQTGELALKFLENKKREPWIEAPRNLRIILNLRVARKFDIKISEKITAEADQVIE
ncbi:MAG: hypothetical protein JRJ08_00210 [Deltaproteobacteria bacterium]|nr:hypothetical protein [Deltaproteobacteria bacterium]